MLQEYLSHLKLTYAASSPSVKCHMHDLVSASAMCVLTAVAGMAPLILKKFRDLHTYVPKLD